MLEFPSQAGLAHAEDFAAVEVTRQGEAKQSGWLVSITDAVLGISPEQPSAALLVELRSGGEATSIERLPIESISKIRLPNATPIAAPANPKWATLLAGSRLETEQISSDGAAVQLTFADGWQCSVPAGMLNSIQLNELSDLQLEQWNMLTAAAITSDVLSILRPNDQLERIEGIVESIDAAVVNFDFGGQAVAVPFEKLAGLRTFTSKKVEELQPSVVVLDVCGNRWMAAKLSMEGGSDAISVRMPSGLEISMPLERIAELDFSIGGASYLAELSPIASVASTRDQPLSNVAGLSQVMGPRPIEFRPADSRVTTPSLLFPAGGTISYRVPQGFSRFVGQVRLHPTGDRFSSSRVSVRVESQVVWTAVLDSPESVPSFELPIEPDARLELIVEPQSDLPVGSTVLWEGVRVER